MADLSEGQVIQAPFLDGPAEIKSIKEHARSDQLEVFLQDSGEFRTPRMYLVNKIEPVDEIPEVRKGDPEQFFLSIEANRI
jgi:hypothetical protein